MNELPRAITELDPLNRLDDVAAFAKVHRRTVERAVERGELEVLHAGGAVRITDDAVWAWLHRDTPSRRLSSIPAGRRSRS